MVARFSASREDTHTHTPPKGDPGREQNYCVRRGRNRLNEHIRLLLDRLLDGVRRSVASRQET